MKEREGAWEGEDALSSFRVVPQPTFCISSCLIKTSEPCKRHQCLVCCLKSWAPYRVIKKQLPRASKQSLFALVSTSLSLILRLRLQFLDPCVNKEEAFCRPILCTAPHPGSDKPSLPPIQLPCPSLCVSHLALKSETAHASHLPRPPDTRQVAKATFLASLLQ